MNPSAAQRRAGACAAAVAVAVAGMGPLARAQDPAPADDGGPIVVGERNEEFQSFVIERVRAVVKMMARYRSDERKRPGEPTTHDTETILRPSLQISTDAYILHPNFIELSLTAGVLLDDDNLESDTLGLSEHTTSLDTNYDFQAFILGKSSMPATVYSRRNQTSVDRLFGPTLDSTLTEHGGILSFVNQRAPTTIQYFHRDQRQTDAGGRLDFDVAQDSFSLRSNILISDSQTLSLDYALDAIQQSGNGRVAQDFIRNDATALHVLTFGDGRVDNLRSRIRWYDQTGVADVSRLTIDESLRLKHSDTLQTRYDLYYQTQSRTDSSQDFLRGNFNITHHLFESLTTTANIGASTLDSDGFTSNEYFGDVTFDYVKKVPYGLFSASASVSENVRSNGPRGALLRIFDESRTFSDPAPIVLARQNILSASIVITDVSGLVFFDEGLDYTLQVFADRIEIRRVVTGGISDGQTVLIDYTVGPEPPSTFSTTGLSASVRYDINRGFLEGLGLYMRYHQRDANINSPNPDFFVPDNTNDLIFGADYATGPFWFNAEYENSDSTISPFTATRFEARYTQNFGRGSAFSVDGSYQMIDFPSINNQIDLALISANLSQRLTNQLRLTAQVIWRDEINELNGNTQGFEQRVTLNWRYRQTEVYLSGRNAMFTSTSEDRLAQSVEVGFRRNF